VDVVIVDLTHTNIVQHVLTTTTHAVTIIAQNKASEQMPGNDFILP
jgi:hypothetical protein